MLTIQGRTFPYIFRALEPSSTTPSLILAANLAALKLRLRTRPNSLAEKLGAVQTARSDHPVRGYLRVSAGRASLYPDFARSKNVIRAVSAIFHRYTRKDSGPLHPPGRIQKLHGNTGIEGLTILPPTTISVVIPAYNAEGCLLETVQSVLAQTRPADEIIIIDDGSKDSTQAVALSFGNRVRYIWQQNGGIASARNAGIQAATSDWIAFLDHDDLMLPQKLEEQVRVIDAHESQVSGREAKPELVVVYSAFDFLYTDGSTRQIPVFPASQLWPALRYRTPILPSTSIIRRSALVEIGGFKKLYCIDDWNLWFRLIRRFSSKAFREVPQSLTLYRWWENNESKNFMPVQQAVLEMLDTLLLEDLTGFHRWLWHRRIRARIYYGLALNLRAAGSDRYWEYALESMILWPLPGKIIPNYRYKVFASMLLTRLRSFRFQLRYWWPRRQCREDMRMPTAASTRIGQTT